MHTPKTKITEAEKQAVKMLKAKGLEASEIAAVTGIGRTTVFTILKEKEGEQPDLQTIVENQEEQIRLLRALLEAFS